MDIKIWKDLLNLESDDYFIMIKNSIDEEFFLNDMKCLDKIYEISPYLKNWKLTMMPFLFKDIFILKILSMEILENIYQHISFMI